MAREIKTGEIVALKKIRMDNEREGVRTFLYYVVSIWHIIPYILIHMFDMFLISLCSFL